MGQSGSFKVWIEAEEWSPGSWTPEDANTDVIVTFNDGSRWVATFVSYANVRTLTEKNRRTGECLAGAYLWVSDMILIEDTSRARIESVIQELIREGELESCFGRLPSDDAISRGSPR